ncbi:MAG: hypothetical protein H6635_17080 [Anaerolineales bacterium]|nr:hypothetical protein [Anaerolineales bacterium]
MNFHRKRKNKIKNNFKAGGTDYVPPALCPRPAHPSACVPAHVEGTGRAGRHGYDGTRWVRPVTGNPPILTWEAAC